MRLINEEVSFTVEANLPQEAFDKILGNTREQMEKMLQQGYAFDLSNGEDRTVAYISFPKGTKPEDVAIVVRCKDCRNYCHLVGSCKYFDFMPVKEDDFCSHGY